MSTIGQTTKDHSADDAPSRYVVGIDLGTTNCAVAFVDTSELENQGPGASASPAFQVRTFKIPQWIAPNEIEARETLPSFHYQPLSAELQDTKRRLPWERSPASWIVGVHARDSNVSRSGRVIASAKSWLCHKGVDREAAILPWQATEDVDRISPVEASSRYLLHMRSAWDHAHPGHPLAEQDIVLTLPASFDEVARELTVEAAKKAGLKRIALIEEPQAAFYAWINKHVEDWDRIVSPGQKILVCDIGGGTTDFTLIRVRKDEQGRAQFHRVAVGEHLILGGDNLDLALAKSLEAKISPNAPLEPRRWEALLRASRDAKETLLGDNAPDEFSIVLPGTGAKLIGGSQQVKVSKQDVETLLLDGFMPRTKLGDRPERRVSGFQEFGLPFASDPAITKHLAIFLWTHRHAGADEPATADMDAARPDLILFNGGMFAAPAMQQRLLEVVGNWFPKKNDDPTPPQTLANDRLDLAVARGAAYFGVVRRGMGVRIVATLARSYYLGLGGDPPQAVCVLPGSAEPGCEFELKQQEFDLLLAEPVEFPLFVSSVRLIDPPGTMVSISADEFHTLPPLRTVVKVKGRKNEGTTPVRVHARLTEIGTLDLWLSEAHGDRSWRLLFDVRSATQSEFESQSTQGESAGVLDELTWTACENVLSDTFGEAATQNPDTLNKRMADAVELERSQWPPTLLRRMWSHCVELDVGRRLSPVHEARWLNFVGFALRPGYGLALDDWRVQETWRQLQGKLVHPSLASRTEALILWRRIGAGLTPGQQKSLSEPLIATIRALHRRSLGKPVVETPPPPNELVEQVRLLGSLELLPIKSKLELGALFLDLWNRKKLDYLRPALLWGIGRLGARRPLYGPLNGVIGPDQAIAWVKSLATDTLVDPMREFALVQIARRTNDRFRDLPAETRDHVANWLQTHRATIHSIELVTDGGELAREEQGVAFGDSLPVGLRLRTNA